MGFIKIIILCIVGVFGASAIASDRSTLIGPVAVASSDDALHSGIHLSVKMPTKVAIYQNDKLIKQVSYDKAGNYDIDVVGWPKGVYRIVLKSHGRLSQIAMQQVIVFELPGQINVKVGS